MRRSFVTLAITVVAALIAAGCGKFGQIDKGSAKNTASTKGQVSGQPFNDAAKKAAGCAPIFTKANETRTHTDKTVVYDHNPPVGGDHNPVPLAWGVYDSPQPDERWVHNLEHGHVVIVYKGLSSKELNDLLALRDKAPYHLVVIPRDKNPKAGVYYQAWGTSLYCAHPSGAALQYMIDNYVDQGPELFTTDQAK